jgi:hypothetical protein
MKLRYYREFFLKNRTRALDAVLSDFAITEQDIKDTLKTLKMGKAGGNDSIDSSEIRI